MTPENNDLIGRMRKNCRAARAARTLSAEFFGVVKRQREMFQFQIVTATLPHNSN